MFRTERMRKLKVVTLGEYTSEVINLLHENGIVQLDDISERIQQDPELAEQLTPSKTTSYTGKISSLLMRTTGISELLGDALSEGLGIKEKLMSFISPEVPVPKEVNDLDTEAFIEYAENILDEVESETKVIEEKLYALDTETSQLESNKVLASRLANLNMNLGLLKDTKHTSTIVGRIDVESASEVKTELSKITDELLIERVKDNNKEFENIVVVTQKEYKDNIYSSLRKFDFEKFDTENLEGSPSEIVSNADTRLKAIESEQSQIKAQLKQVAEKWDDDILVLKEQLEIEKERNEVFAAFGETRETNVFEAWVPLKRVDEAKSLIESASEENCIIEIEDIEDNDENVPVLQNNNAYAKPYEVLVQMYSPLKYNEIDPTLFVAITFPFFFGFCLTDAFYGLIVALLGLVLYKGMGKVNDTMKAAGPIVMASGIWAIILGLITNGMIGDFWSRILNLGTLPTVIPWLDAFKNPATILIIAIVCGLIYTNLGFVIGMINNLRYGDVKEAFGSQICWFFLEAGVVFLALGMLVSSIGMIGYVLGALFIIIALGMLIYANGAYGMMDVFGFMGDILSYARLLALCLATGGIAMTVNILTNLVGDMIPFVGIIFAIFVFIFGHIANFMFQVLGAFVNALRLNYVEFFSQFYLGGKNQFEAFKAKRIFTKFNK